MKAAAWFAGGVVTGIALVAAGAVALWLYRADYDPQEMT